MTTLVEDGTRCLYEDVNYYSNVYLLNILCEISGIQILQFKILIEMESA